MSALQDEALQLASALIDDIELSQSSTARRVLKAQRLARLTNNTRALEWISFELNGSARSQASDDWMTRTGRWTDREAEKGFRKPAAELESARDSFKLAIQGFSAPVSLAGDYLLPAMSNQRKAISSYAENIKALETILHKIDQEIYQFATESYNELRFSQIQESLFDTVRSSIDAELTGMANDALRLIDSVAERLGGDNRIASSQAMATCRQLIDAVADHLFPPRDSPYLVSEDRILDVKKNSVKNRLNAHIHRCGIAGSRAARLGKTLNEIYARVSSSVHDSSAVSPHEARYIFLGTYLLLGEIVTLPPGHARPTGTNITEARSSSVAEHPTDQI